MFFQKLGASRPFGLVIHAQKLCGSQRRGGEEVSIAGQGRRRKQARQDNQPHTQEQHSRDIALLGMDRHRRVKAQRRSGRRVDSPDREQRGAQRAWERRLQIWRRLDRDPCPRNSESDDPAASHRASRRWHAPRSRASSKQRSRSPCPSFAPRQLGHAAQIHSEARPA